MVTGPQIAQASAFPRWVRADVTSMDGASAKVFAALTGHAAGTTTRSLTCMNARNSARPGIGSPWARSRRNVPEALASGPPGLAMDSPAEGREAVAGGDALQCRPAVWDEVVRQVAGREPVQAAALVGLAVLDSPAQRWTTCTGCISGISEASWMAPG